jgi:TPR repeat protein
MLRPFVSIILLCACLVAFSANTNTHASLTPSISARHELAALGLDAASQARELEALRLGAANKSNPEAVLKLAKFLYNEGKRMRNHREACGLFEDASVRGSSEATAWLGSCYLYGRGVEKRDVARGVSLIQAAAQADDAAGLMFLGLLYENGAGVERDYAKAADHFSRAVSKGYGPAYARLARLYMRGIGVKQNRRMAFELLNQGAQLGDPRSQLRLGKLAMSGFVGPQGEYLSRRSLTPSYETARQFFSQAAAQGDRTAAFKMGKMYENQNGVAGDQKKAAAYYMHSARAGDPRAQLELGRLSENVGPRGPLYSYAWYSLAISQGNEMARERLDALRAKMTPDQAQEAEKLLARWKDNRFCHGCRREQSTR